jgi:hypothetical protein
MAMRHNNDTSVVDRKMTRLPTWRLRIIEQVEREAAERAAREAHRARQAAKNAAEEK